ncbi:MAG: hypothetical protein M1151_05635 [Candidatus Thermoplasmatota archaeon]|jgi:hypothetical protein|nr:hypothetical protein [Candidatus Thermoplasmatota archaeon]MCL5786129.1 hypothetical protein [Candidatus Thermoplasmatota archaeon]
MIEIKKGGKYVVISGSGTEEPMRTEGEFLGYTILGEEGAIVFRIKDKDGSNMVRVIPVGGLYAVEFKDEEQIKIKDNSNSHDKESAYYIN